MVNATNVRAGMFFAATAAIDPAKLVRGLAEVVEFSRILSSDEVRRAGDRTEDRIVLHDDQVALREDHGTRREVQGDAIESRRLDTARPPRPRVIDEREATILRLRYGLGEEGSEPMTLKEIGKVVGLTRERVRQIEREALRRLFTVMGGEE